MELREYLAAVGRRRSAVFLNLPPQARVEGITQTVA